MIMLEAVYHRIGLNWSYAYHESTVHIRLRTKRDNVARVQLVCGDKYSWEKYNESVNMERFASDGLFDYWQAAIRPRFRRVVYYFALQEEAGQTVYFLEKGFFDTPPAILYEGLFDFPFLNREDVHSPPEWVKEAVFYQIFPERFAKGDPSIDPEGVLEWGGVPSPTNFFGGDLQGVIDRLDHLTDLGINVIYFNPLFFATTNHKYDTRDYMLVDPQFGTNEKLKELIDACHASDIRVILDGVFNHCGHTFPPFVDVQKNGLASRYADWFHIKEWPLKVENGIPNYATFGFEPIMPKLNTGNEEVKAYLLEVGRYWIGELGLDGWRLDVANEVDHQFWREFRREIKRVNPDAYLLGEIMHDAMPWLQGDQFDAVMNYPFTNIVLDFFARRRTDAIQFAQSINTQLASFPQQVTEAAFNLLGSHDTVRLLTLCGGNVRQMKLAVLFQLTFQGAPCIYYGDEIGLDGEHDPYNRKCMEWDPAKQDRELLAFFRHIIALRKSHPCLRGSGLKFLAASGQPQLLAYERMDEQERFLLLLNNDAAALSVTVQTGGQSALWLDAGSDGDVQWSDGVVQVELPGFGYAILHAPASSGSEEIILSGQKRLAQV
ncbi:glycoside hydrolase family 13 protein [Paenibacillus sp. GCM10027626]|uniref:glycoside hydrolase family 13 protein n=1 Tax=Paenibacillus sp. GCM10027626 TaxID=3273411 RepID=UPI00363C5CC3